MRIEQRARQSRQQAGSGSRAGGLGRVIGRPKTPQPGKSAHRQRLDARVLDQCDQRNLQGFQLADRTPHRSQRQMSRRVRHSREINQPCVPRCVDPSGIGRDGIGQQDHAA